MDGARAPLQQMQSSPQGCRAAESLVQSEIAALGTSLVQDSRYLVGRLEHNNDQTGSSLVKNPFENGCQAKTKIF